MHIGTNSLRRNETSAKCADEIISLAKATKRALLKTTIVISGLTTRTDNDILATKANEVNSCLKRLCQQKHWDFMDHSNITSRYLNRSGVHLNRVGTILARNFSNNILY